MSRILQSPGQLLSESHRTREVIGELDKSGQVGGLIRTGKLTYY